MGFFDRVKDVLTSSDAERAQKAKEAADRATEKHRETAEAARADYEKTTQKAQDAELQAREQAEELRQRAELPEDPTTADDAAAAEAKAQEAAEQARRKEADAARKAEATTQKKAQKAVEKQAQAEELQHAAEVEAGGEGPYRTVTVQRGDTFAAIAEREGVSAERMARLNGLDNPDLIYPGQVFKVPNA